tara:strand:+ start:998 stop:1204 length:207 start_codon:yes stop_codon:yes gene_type:complete
MGEIYDFTEYKLHQLMERAAKAKRPDVAEQLSIALDAYLMGEVTIKFVEGWPVAYLVPANDNDIDIDT